MTLGGNPLAWPRELWEEWDERAGIIAADTGCSREESEQLAEEDVRRRVERGSQSGSHCTDPGARRH